MLLTSDNAYKHFINMYKDIRKPKFRDWEITEKLCADMDRLIYCRAGVESGKEYDVALDSYCYKKPVILIKNGKTKEYKKFTEDDNFDLASLELLGEVLREAGYKVEIQAPIKNVLEKIKEAEKQTKKPRRKMPIENRRQRRQGRGGVVL
jgi:hypothetical protein